MHLLSALLSSRRAFILAGGISVLLAAPAQAANKTWNGGGLNDNWLTGPNWDLQTAPAINDALFFGGTTRLAPVNNYAADTLFNSITFNTGAGAFNLSGNALILSPGLSAGAGTVSGGNIANNSASAQTVSLPVTLAPGNHAITTGAGQLNLAGTFSRSVGSTAVLTRAGGNINFFGSGLQNDASGILGGWAVTNIGTNTGDWAALDGSGNVVAYTGYVPAAPGDTIASGALQNIRISANGAATNTTAGLTEVNTLLYNGNAGNQTIAIGTGNTLRLGAKGAIMITTGSLPSGNRQFIIGAAAGQGTLTAGGADNQPGEIFLYNNTFTGTNNDLTINAAITDNGTGPVTLNIMGYIALANVANSFSGNTYINQGRVQAGSASSFGTGDVFVYPGAEAFLNNAGTFANDFIISGVGPTEVSSAQHLGAIRMGTASSAISGTITLVNDARISGGSGGNHLFSGKITGTGRLELSAATGNNGSIVFSNPANDWSGGLLLTATAATRQVVLKAGADNVIPDGAGKGDVSLNGTASVVTFDLNGFEETINGLAAAASTNNVVTNTGAGPATLRFGNNDATASFGGVIQNGVNPLSIVKIGAGSQTLSGANTYTGATVVNGGALVITGTLAAGSAVAVNSAAELMANGVVNGTVAVNDGGTLSGSGTVNGAVTVNDGGRVAGGASGNGTLTLAGGLTIGATATDTAALFVTRNAVPGVINVPGALTINSGTASVTVNVLGAVPALGQHTLIDYGTLGGTGFPAFTLGIVAGRVQAQLVENFANASVDLEVTGAGDFPIWTGAVSGEWSTATLAAPKNWILNSNAATTDYQEADAVLFTDAGAITGLTIPAAITPSSVTFNNETKTYTINGAAGIAGSATFEKSGAGRATVATNNSHTGATTINGGILEVGNGGSTGTLGSGAIQNNSTLIFNRVDNFTVGNLISGTGDLEKKGAGILTLSGANSYEGQTLIGTGTVRVTNSNSLGALIGGGVIIGPGGTLDLSGNPTGNNLNFGQKQFSISGDGVGGAGAIVNNGGVNQQNALQRVALLTDASLGGTVRYDIRAAQSGGVNQAVVDLAGHTLTKNGPFFLALVNADVTDGDIVVNAGTLNLEGTTSIPASATGGQITMNPGTILQFFNNTAAVSTVLREVVFNGAVTMGNSNAANSIIGSPMILQGDVTVNSINTNTVANLLTLTGPISGVGAHSLTKIGLGALTLAGNNSYTGGTTLNDGTLRADSATALGASNSPLAVNGGTLDLMGNSLAVGSLRGTGGVVTSTVGGAITLTTNAAQDTTFAGAIQNGAGEVALVKAGAGGLTLTGANTYTGGTSVNAGALVVNGSLSGAVSVNGGTLKGTGVVGAVTLTTGILAPGGSAGILNTADLSLAGGAFSVEIDGNAAGNGPGFHDQVNVTGGVTFFGPVALTLDFTAYDPVDGIDSFVIVRNDGADPIGGLETPGARLFFGATELEEGTLFTATSGAFTQHFSITYAGGESGNDVVLHAVPEPAVSAVFFAGLAVLVARRREKRRLA